MTSFFTSKKSHTLNSGDQFPFSVLPVFFCYCWRTVILWAVRHFLKLFPVMVTLGAEFAKLLLDFAPTQGRRLYAIPYLPILGRLHCVIRRRCVTTAFRVSTPWRAFFTDRCGSFDAALVFFDILYHRLHFLRRRPAWSIRACTIPGNIQLRGCSVWGKR